MIAASALLQVCAQPAWLQLSALRMHVFTRPLSFQEPPAKKMYTIRRFALTACALLALLLVPYTAKPADNTVVEVPFTLEKGHIIVQAKMHGDKPVEIVLATGAEHSLINALLLEKYKLQAYYTGEGIITGSSLDRTVTFVNVTDIRLGGVKVTSLSMRFGAQVTSDISSRVGREIFAILGADFFKGRVVQFDFGQRVVRFLPQSPDVPKDAPGAAATARRAVLPIRHFNERLILPIVEDVTYNGKKVKTLFDTGALTVISLAPSGAKQAGLEAPPEKGMPRADKLGSLRLGDMEFNDLPVTLHPKGFEFGPNSQGAGAVVGVALLQNFVVTFDFRGKMVILEQR